MRWEDKIVQMSLLFIGEVNLSSLHATSHLSSMQTPSVKLVTCISCILQHVMHATIHFTTMHYMRNATCLTCTMDMCLATKVALPINNCCFDIHCVLVTQVNDKKTQRQLTVAGFFSYKPAVVNYRWRYFSLLLVFLESEKQLSYQSQYWTWIIIWANFMHSLRLGS